MAELHDPKAEAADYQETEDIKGPNQSSLKLDARGVPLVPQPSDHKDDPLVRLNYSRFSLHGPCGFAPSLL